MRSAAILAVALAGCAGTHARVSMPVGGVKIPFELVADSIVVRARLGNHTDLSAVLDTGANMLVLTPEAALRAGLVSAPRAMSLEGVDGKTQRTLTTTQPTRLALRDLVVRNLEAIVIPEFRLAAETTGIAIDALVGGALLGPSLVTIDYPGHELRVEQGALPEPNGKDVIAANYDDGTPKISISVAGVNVTATVDSGCFGNTFDLPESLSKVVPLRGRSVETAHDGINGSGHGTNARLDGAVRVGGYSIVDPSVYFSGPEARVCSMALREFSVTLDSAHRRIRFARSSFDPIVVPPRHTIGVGLSKRGGRWVVSELVHELAPSGVAIGDEAVSYNGKPCAALTREGLVDLMRDSKVVHLVLRRAGALVELDAPVHEL